MKKNFRTSLWMETDRDRAKNKQRRERQELILKAIGGYTARVPRARRGQAANLPTYTPPPQQPLRARNERGVRGLKEKRAPIFMNRDTGLPYTDPRPPPQVRTGSRTVRPRAGPDRRGRVYQESNWFITVNMNVKPPTGDIFLFNNAKSALENACEFVGRNLDRVVKFGPYTTDYKDDVYDDVMISTKFQYAVEQGLRQGRIHAHILLQTVHISQIRLKHEELVAEFRRVYNETAQTAVRTVNGGGPYIQIQLLSHSGYLNKIRSYMTKQIPNFSMDNMEVI